ncbi:MAG: hypothetical protein DMG96_05235 [Acidobacteria bacterium]|nr:MAG: hypothetical protein DMG96_05235 [Acidobacteriota bacterium]
MIKDVKEKPIRGGLARLFKRPIFCFIVMVHDVTGSRKVYGTIISLSVCYWQQVDFGASIVAGASRLQCDQCTWRRGPLWPS